VVAAVLVLVLGFAAEVPAATPRGLLAQRRGFRMPTRPPIVDSSPTIETLNKALKALGSTDRDYDGHREKAITHIGLAIRQLENPYARKGNVGAAVSKAVAGTSTKTSKTSQAASDESLRTAKTILFSVHHKLADHTSTKGHIRADAEVRIAISELVAALNPAPAAKTKTKAKPKASAAAPAPAATRSR
jgi:hypothetical protein